MCYADHNYYISEYGNAWKTAISMGIDGHI